MLPVKLIHRLGVLRIDVAEANVLADNGSVLGFHQANRTSPLPARNAPICSRLPASESSMLMINTQHPVLPLQAHLV